ncbi:polysaccharide lyase family 7 protein [Actinoplanes sp. NPDC023714]|uniref:polysaccharide lyase family 7 protein n=1 Tax=Actinoplanes sp. NPDC023714 TaxID=3154322 RepID=UPI0033D692BF
MWQLQLPTGSPGKPDTISPARLKGASGYTNAAYFWTDKNDGSMTFWAPEKGVTTPNSKYARSELREMNRDGSAADWTLAGNHTLSAQLRVVSVTKNVAVGQVKLGTGGTSTKPLAELYYRANGDIYLGTQNSPDASGQTLHRITNVPLGAKWTYVKAGSYNQSSSESTTNGAKVKFYSLTVQH